MNKYLLALVLLFSYSPLMALHNPLALVWKALPDQGVQFSDNLHRALYTLPALETQGNDDAKHVINLNQLIKNSHQALSVISKNIDYVDSKSASFRQALKECLSCIEGHLEKAQEYLWEEQIHGWNKRPDLIRNIQHSLFNAFALRNGLQDIVEHGVLPAMKEQEDHHEKMILKKVHDELQRMQQESSASALIKETVTDLLHDDELDNVLREVKKLLIKRLNNTTLCEQWINKYVKDENHKKIITFLLKKGFVKALIEQLKIDDKELKDLLIDVIKGNKSHANVVGWFMRSDAINAALSKIDTNDDEFKEIVRKASSGTIADWLPNFVQSTFSGLIKNILSSQIVRGYLAGMIDKQKKQFKTSLAEKKSHDDLCTYLYMALNISDWRSFEDRCPLLLKGKNPFIGATRLRFNGVTAYEYSCPFTPHISPYKSKEELLATDPSLKKKEPERGEEEEGEIEVGFSGFDTSGFAEIKLDKGAIGCSSMFETGCNAVGDPANEYWRAYHAENTPEKIVIENILEALRKEGLDLSQAYGENKLEEKDLQFFIDVYAKKLMGTNEKLKLDYVKEMLTTFTRKHEGNTKVFQFIIAAINKREFLQELPSNMNMTDLSHFIFQLWIRAELNKEIEKGNQLGQLVLLDKQLLRYEALARIYTQRKAAELPVFEEQLKKNKSKSFFSRLINIKGWYIWLKAWWNHKVINQRNKAEENAPRCVEIIQDAIDSASTSEELRIFDVLYNINNNKKMRLSAITHHYFDEFKNPKPFLLSIKLAEHVDNIFWHCISSDKRPQKHLEPSNQYGREIEQIVREQHQESNHQQKDPQEKNRDKKFDCEQVKVAQQGMFTTTCGAHSLYNVFNIGTQIVSNNRDTNINRDELFAAIKESVGSLNWLEISNIIDLVTQFSGTYNITFPIVVIGDIKQCLKGDNLSQGMLEKLSDLRDKLKSNDDFVFGVIRGTMIGAQRSRWGHWTGDVIFRRDGKLQIKRADSNSEKGDTDRNAEALNLYTRLMDWNFIITGDTLDSSPVVKAKNKFIAIQKMFKQGQYAYKGNKNGPDNMYVRNASINNLIDEFLDACELLLQTIKGEITMIQEAGLISPSMIKTGLEVLKNKEGKAFNVYANPENKMVEIQLTFSQDQKNKLEALLTQVTANGN